MKFLLKLFSETVISLVLLFVLVCFINPFGLWMTDGFHMTLLGLVTALFSVFAMFLWKDGAQDERESLHRFISARFAYVVGGVLLLIGTIFQAFTHQLDLWLPLVLAGMVFAKIVGRVYARRRY